MRERTEDVTSSADISHAEGKQKINSRPAADAEDMAARELEAAFGDALLTGVGAATKEKIEEVSTL